MKWGRFIELPTLLLTTVLLAPLVSPSAAQMSSRPAVAPPAAPSVRLQNELRDILRDWAEGDATAPERWAAVQLRVFDTITQSNPGSALRRRAAVDCLEKVEASTFEPLYEQAPEVALLRLELFVRSFAVFRHGGHANISSQLLLLLDPLLEDALGLDEQIDRRLEPLPGDRGLRHAERAGTVVTRSLVQVADSLQQQRLISTLERARELYEHAAKRARRALRRADRRTGGRTETENRAEELFASDRLVLDAGLYWTASLLLREGEDDEALEVFEEAIEQRPELGELRLLRAMTLRRVGRKNAAREEYERLSEPPDGERSHDLPPWVRRVAWQERVDLAAGGSSSDEARSLVRRALAVYPDDRGLRLQALALDVFAPPTVVDAGAYLADALAAEPGQPIRTSSRFRTERPRRVEVEQIRRLVATDQAAALAVLPGLLDSLDVRERVDGRPEISQCRRAFDEG